MNFEELEIRLCLIEARLLKVETELSLAEDTALEALDTFDEDAFDFFSDDVNPDGM